ncbi:MAG: serine hydrolase [Candidatus Woesebacteria bacterium]|nr:serine hydrolase [Candidatus Woesebacteria bacterium]
MWSKDNNLLIFILILVALEAILFLSGNFKLIQKQKLEEARLAKIEQVFDTAPVLAKTFSVYDGTERKEIYRRNGNAILPLASLSKIMTVIVALEKYNPKDTLTVLKNSPEENKNNALILGEKWKVKDLAKFTLVSSSNTGALTLAQNDKNFLSEMNTKAKALGMSNSTFSNFTGLDINQKEAGSYGKAQDVNLMVLYAVEKYPEIFGSTIFPSIVLESLSRNIHNVKNTNTIISKIPNLLFSKTGFTTLAGGNLTIIFKNKSNHNIAITLLGSTEVGRFSDMEKLVEIANKF